MMKRRAAGGEDEDDVEAWGSEDEASKPDASIASLLHPTPSTSFPSIPLSSSSSAEWKKHMNWNWKQILCNPQKSLRYRIYLSAAVVITCLLVIFSFYHIIYRVLIIESELARGLLQAQKLGIPTNGAALDFLPILMPVCGRPNYLKTVLDSLAKASNIDNTIIVFSSDCNDPEVDQLISNLQHPSRSIILRHTRPYLGIPSIKDNEYATSTNVKFLLEFAFDYLHAPGAIILESDVEPSADFYDYFTWMFDNVLNKDEYSRVLNINGFDYGSRKESDPYALRTSRFMVWGWSTSRRNWPILKAGWTRLGNWDHRVQRIREEHGMVSLSPSLARTKHIGMKGINFNVDDAGSDNPWMRVFISREPIDFEDKAPEITGWPRRETDELQILYPSE